jgi:hypothetical protein
VVPGQNLTGIDFFFLVVPVTLVLFGWIGLVLWASFHPKVRRRGPVARSVLAQGAADEGERGAGAGPAPTETVPRQPGVAEQDAAGRIPRQQTGGQATGTRQQGADEPTPGSPGPAPSQRPAGPGRRT